MKTTIKATKNSIKTPNPKATVHVPLTTIYIGNLKYDRDERDIKELFSEFGKVKSVDVVLDPETEKSKGIAFVKMFDAKEAKIAISALNGAIFDGRTLKVSIANDRFAVPTLTENKEEPSKIKSKSKQAPPKKQGLDVLFNYLNTRK